MSGGMKRGSSQPEFPKPETTTSGPREISALVELVRLLARQAARECTDRRPKDDHPTPALPFSEQQS